MPIQLAQPRPIPIKSMGYSLDGHFQPCGAWGPTVAQLKSPIVQLVASAPTGEDANNSYS